MANGTFFVQACPTCGRRLNIRVEHLGRKMVCQHCRGRFTACDPAGRSLSEADSADAIMQRAERLLQHIGECEARSNLMHPN